MNPITPSRKLEIGCDIALAVVVIFTGLLMASLLHALGTPLPKGELRIDMHYEVSAMALILNLVLPLGVAALAVSTGIKIRGRSLQPLALLVSLSALVGIFACSIGVFDLFVAMHRPINLWTQIWWTFSS